MEKQNGTIWMTAREFSEKTGLLLKSIQSSFLRHNLVSQRINKLLHYQAAPSILTNENTVYIEGCITLHGLATQLGLHEDTVMHRLLVMGEKPVMYGKVEGFVYKLRDGLLDDLRNKHPRSVKTEDIVYADETSQSLQADAKMKKQWIGKKGQLVVDGQVYAEGIIESVSECGVFVAGVRGYLRELRLAPEN